MPEEIVRKAGDKSSKQIWDPKLTYRQTKTVGYFAVTPPDMMNAMTCPLSAARGVTWSPGTTMRLPAKL
jgi:hypothetical protein